MGIGRRFLFLVNPISGTRGKAGLEAFLARQCHKHGIAFTVLQSTPYTTAAMVEMALYEFEATDLIACGGDGTVNIAAAAAMAAEVPLGIIPVGSGNGLARTARIPLKPSQAFEVLLQGNRQVTDAFTINNHFGCMLSGLGMDAAVAERFAQSQRRGLYTYTTETLFQFFKASPYQFEIQLPDFSFFTDAFFISVANSNQYGNNMTIAPQASLSDGLLDVIVVQKMPKANLPFAIMRQMRHNTNLRNWVGQIGKQSILYFQVPAITVKNLKHAPLHIDGDPVASTDQVTFSILPQAFQLWIPGSEASRLLQQNQQQAAM
ncbi:MAG: diacylglycerol kinase [Chitinophagaceae bacterium]|jgi:diacylglycerol kinase family enzyme|nr:diacylglycerol kinase [Chitinophagaceae bacterium]